MTRLVTRIALCVFVLTMSLSVFAISKSGDFMLFQKTLVNGKTLPAGRYVVDINTSGTTAQLKFLKDGKEMATVTGQVKQLTIVPHHDQIITRKSGNTTTIAEVDFGRTKTAVMLSNGK